MNWIVIILCYNNIGIKVKEIIDCTPTAVLFQSIELEQEEIFQLESGPSVKEFQLLWILRGAFRCFDQLHRLRILK